MKKILLLNLLVALSFTINFGQTAPTVGDGSESNPYEIGTLDNLKWIEADDSRWDKHYKQVANIDLEQTSIRIGDGSTTSFTGSYDGNGYVIDNLTMDRGGQGWNGIFGLIEGATIKNLGLTNVSVTGGSYTGALIGQSKNSTVTNCYSTGSVTGSYSYIGGLVGECEGTTTISECYSECTVTGTASGDTQVHAGGLVGDIRSDPIIEKSYATGDVTVSASTQANTSVGGLVGYNYGTISECYSRGDVVGNINVGGFVGTSYYSSAHISNCYSFGNVTRHTGTETKTAGFVGNFGGSGATIDKCYSIGSVTYDGATDPTDKGFVGSGSGTTNCFFDNEASNQTSDASATGKTTAEMKTQSTFENAGWDFTSIWEIIAPASSSSNSLAKTNADGNYPNLQNNPNSALPVELTAFTATVSDDVVLLSWSTATEVNNYGFEVERKQTDSEWNKVGFVEGSGNSNSPKYYTYSDNTQMQGKYLYRLKQIDIDGKFEYSNEIEVNLNTPLKYTLEQNYPNPFNPTTSIRFSLPEAAKVKLVVYNIIGEKVAELVNGKMEAGIHSVIFDAAELTSGVYIYKIVTDYSGGTRNNIKSMKMLLIK